MTVFKRYFKHLLKNTLRPIIVITVIMMVLCFLSAMSEDKFYEYQYDINTGEVLNYRYEYEQDYYDEYYNDYYYNNYYDKDVKPSEYIKTYSSLLSFPMSILLALSFAVPISQFKFFKKRQNLDCVYSLPLSRKNFALAHYLVGLVYLFVPALVLYLQLFLRITLDGGWLYLSIKYVALQFLTSFLFAWALYSCVTFIYNEANNNLDGIIFIVLWQGVVSTVTEFLAPYSMYTYLFQVPSALATAAETTTYELYHIGYVETANKTYPIYYTLAWVLLGIAATALLLKRFGKVRTEKVEGISDSIFGYKLLIPFNAAMMLFWFDWEEKTLYIESALGITTLILALIGYAVYRRGLKLKKSDIIVLGIIGALSLIAYFGIDAETYYFTVFSF